VGDDAGEPLQALVLSFQGSLLPVTFQRVPDGASEEFGLEMLLEEVVLRALLDRLQRHLLVGQSSQDDDGKRRGGGGVEPIVQSFQRLDTAAVREAEVE